MLLRVGGEGGTRDDLSGRFRDSGAAKQNAEQEEKSWAEIKKHGAKMKAGKVALGGSGWL